MPVGVVLFVLALSFVPASAARAHRRLDMVGIAQLGVGLLALMLAVSYLGSGRSSPASAQFVVPAAVGLVSIALFVRHSGRAEHPFVPLHLLRGAGFAVMNLINFFYGIAVLGFSALVPLYAEDRYGLSSLAAGTLLTARAVGMIAVAVPLGAAGLGLLGWLPFSPAGFGARTQKSAGQASRVRSAFLEMELDHDSGAMRGRILAGAHEGASLDSLDVGTLVGLLAGIDEESRALLAAYLDRRDAGWREHAQGDAAAGRGFAPTGKMTDEEAYQILGLQPGASAEDVTRAHRSLMKKLHPDQGGSTYLAARVNEAKETLLRRHR